MEEKTISASRIDGMIIRCIKGCLMVFVALCVLAGVISSKPHCILIAFLAAALLWAFIKEGKNNG